MSERIELGQHRRIEVNDSTVQLQHHGSTLTAFIASGRVGLDYGETTNPVIDTYDLKIFMEQVEKAEQARLVWDLAVAEVKESASRVYTPEGVQVFMSGENVLLDGETPFALIARGEKQRVLDVIDGMAEGVFS